MYCALSRVWTAQSVRKFQSDFPTQDEEKRRQSQACSAVQSPFRIYDYPSRPWDALRDQDFQWSVPNGWNHRLSRFALTIHHPPPTLPVIKGKLSSSYSLFIAVNSPRFSNFDVFALASTLLQRVPTSWLWDLHRKYNTTVLRTQELRQYRKNGEEMIGKKRKGKGR